MRILRGVLSKKGSKFYKCNLVLKSVTYWKGSIVSGQTIKQNNNLVCKVKKQTYLPTC